MTKRYFHAALVLVCFLVSALSCKKSDDSELAGIITFDNLTLYNRLSITEDVETALSKGEYVITDNILIYDLSGTLVAKLGAKANDWRDAYIGLPQLEKGYYTLISWQTAQSTSGAPGWTLSGEDKLSTVSLLAPDGPIPFIMTLGYSSFSFNSDQFIEVTVRHKPVGSIVTYYVDGFTDDKDYVSSSVIWENKDGHIIGLRLDPSLKDPNLWIRDPEGHDSGTVYPDNPSGSFFTLIHGEEIYTEYWADTPDYAEKLYTFDHAKWEVGDHIDCYLGLDRLNVQPPFCGPETGFHFWYYKRRHGILVAEPLLKWGGNIEEVEEHIQSKPWWKHGNHELEYWEENYASWHKWYYVAHSLTEQYLFETQDGKNLRYVLVCCWDQEEPLETLNNHLLIQEYTYKGKSVLPMDGLEYDSFLSADGKTDAFTRKDEDGSYIIYRPHTQ